ncbi:MAG: hypothetical protein WCO45_03815 [Pseudanabaena sp. ELA607]|jgi:hypothetical protein
MHLVLFCLLGCENIPFSIPSGKKIFTFIAIDNSRSNVDNEQNRKKSQEICKSVVKKQGVIDELILVEFDSDADNPKPRSLKNSSDDSRTAFIKDECSVVATRASKLADPGTDIKSTFQNQFKSIDPSLSSKTQSEPKIAYVFIFSVDALEGAQYQPENPKVIEFKSSVGKFLESGNFLLIFVNDDTDREKLSRFLKDFVTKYKERLYIGDAKNYQKKISQIYADARK